MTSVGPVCGRTGCLAGCQVRFVESEETSISMIMAQRSISAEQLDPTLQVSQQAVPRASEMVGTSSRSGGLAVGRPLV